MELPPPPPQPQKNDARRPEVDTVAAVKLVTQHFIQDLDTKPTATELNAYDDRNFWIKTTRGDFTLKITNEEDSKDMRLVDAQTSLVEYLNAQGITCPCPVPVKGSGAVYFREVINHQLNIVRLLTFVQGKTLTQCSPNNALYYDVGKFLGELTVKMDEYPDELTALKNRDYIWMMEKAPAALQWTHLVQDEQRKEVVTQILRDFQEKIIKFKGDVDRFKVSLSHGDYNENNVIVDERMGKVAGVIDFNDICYTFRLFDIAMAMCYCIMHSGALETAGYVLKGYESVIKLPPFERQHLKLCVLARACQSVILGLHFHALEPSNKYVLSSQVPGWRLIEELAPMSDAAVFNVWDSVKL